jgi:Protein of unknown function (DUF3626)
VSTSRAHRYVAGRAAGDPVDPGLRVTLHFHPDREHGGVPILDALRRDGRYRSQFETGTSNGGLTAFHGGDRWRWESRLFGGAYDDVRAADRPVYGSLNHRRRLTGGSPRFGSAHFRLAAGTLERTTLCFPDSTFEPELVGVPERGSALVDAADAGERDLLDDYVEAHVHGPVQLDRDIEALVLDPCYRGTDVEERARALPCPVEWHPGFRLAVDELVRRPLYRGPEIVELGVAVARDGLLDARIVGDAVRAGRADPQSLKKVWHHVARFGV